jgi:hypothetical protein
VVVVAIVVVVVDETVAVTVSVVDVDTVRVVEASTGTDVIVVVSVVVEVWRKALDKVPSAGVSYSCTYLCNGTLGRGYRCCLFGRQLDS